MQKNRLQIFSKILKSKTSDFRKFRKFGIQKIQNSEKIRNPENSEFEIYIYNFQWTVTKTLKYDPWRFQTKTHQCAGSFPLERRPKPQPKMAICSAEIPSMTSYECGFALVHPPGKEKGGVSLKKKGTGVSKIHFAPLGLCHSRSPLARHISSWYITVGRHFGLRCSQEKPQLLPLSCTLECQTRLAETL